MAEWGHTRMGVTTGACLPDPRERWPEVTVVVGSVIGATARDLAALGVRDVRALVLEAAALREAPQGEAIAKGVVVLAPVKRVPITVRPGVVPTVSGAVAGVMAYVAQRARLRSPALRPLR